MPGRTATLTARSGLWRAGRSYNNADLFRALKGGADRFGIVLRYEVEVFHTGIR